MSHKIKTYELGRRLVKGPRQAVANQAALNDKSTTGQTRMWKKKKTSGTKPSREVALNILQLNICGIQKKKTELAKVLSTHKIHIALLQETLHGSADLHITGYTSYTCDCEL